MSGNNSIQRIGSSIQSSLYYSRVIILSRDSNDNKSLSPIPCDSTQKLSFLPNQRHHWQIPSFCCHPYRFLKRQLACQHETRPKIAPLPTSNKPIHPRMIQSKQCYALLSEKKKMRKSKKWELCRKPAPTRKISFQPSQPIQPVHLFQNKAESADAPGPLVIKLREELLCCMLLVSFECFFFTTIIMCWECERRPYPVQCVVFRGISSPMACWLPL